MIEGSEMRRSSLIHELRFLGHQRRLSSVPAVSNAFGDTHPLLIQADKPSRRYEFLPISAENDCSPFPFAGHEHAGNN